MYTHAYQYTHKYDHKCSVVTDAMAMKRLESDVESFKQKAKDADALRKELEELKNAQRLKVSEYACCIYVFMQVYWYVCRCVCMYTGMHACVHVCISAP
jgi:hypothetical protein